MGWEWKSRSDDGFGGPTWRDFLHQFSVKNAETV